MSDEQQEWSGYARALRQIASARADAQQAQDRLTANRSRAEATALAPWTPLAITSSTSLGCCSSW